MQFAGNFKEKYSMAVVATGALQQFHSRLAAPSAFWTTDGAFATTLIESPRWTSSFSRSSCLTALRSPSSEPRHRHLGSGPCAASSSLIEPAVLYSSQTKAMKPRTLYDVLGISDMVTDDEIKVAFRRIAKQVHPDQAPPDQVMEYQQKFMEAHKAYSVLKDPRTRSLYNFEIRNVVYSKQFGAEDWRRPIWRGCNWETDQCWTS